MAGGIQIAPLLTELRVDLSNFNSQMNSAATAAVGRAREISNNLQSVNKAGESLKSVGGSLTKNLTVPLAAVAGSSLKMSMDFDKSFAKVSTLLDKGTVDFDKYKKDIIKGSNETGIAVGDYSEAVYQSISAGVDQGKAVQFTTEMMGLAKAGFTSGASAVDVVTTALNGYKMKTEEATKVSDMLITTQNLGKTTVDELSSSMGKVIPTASAANFGISELSTSYAVLTKNGIATAEAGTYLRSMLGELTKSGSLTDKALRELAGKGFADLKAEGVPTTEILKMLDDYAKKNGKSLKDMFGSLEAGSAAMTLASQDGKEYNEILAEMEQSSGATSEALEKVEDTAGAKLSKSFNNLKNSLIEVGGALSPFIDGLTTVVGKVADFIGKFEKLHPNTQKFIIALGVVAMAMGPVLSGLGSLILTISSAVTIFGAIKAAALAAGVSVGAFCAPVLITIGVIAGLIAIGAALVLNWDFIKGKASEVWSYISTTISNFSSTCTQWVKDKFEEAKQSVVDSWNFVKDKAVEIWTNIGNFFTQTIPLWIENISNWFNELPYRIGYALGELLGNIVVWGVDTWNYFSTNVPIWINSISTWFSELPGKIWTWLSNSISKVIEWGSQTYNNAKTYTTNTINSIGQWFSQLPGKIWTWLSNSIQKLVQWGSDMVSKGKQGATNTVNSIVTGFTNLPGKVMDIGKNAVKSLWNGISSMGSWISNKVSGFVSGIVDGFKGITNKVSKAVGGKSISIPTVGLPTPGEVPSVDGSHFTGLNYVPFDGYVAKLHKGERVLTANENRDFIQNPQSRQPINLNIENFYNNTDKDIEQIATELDHFIDRNNKF